MKAFNTILVSAACLTLGACSIDIDSDGRYVDYADHEDYMTITLPNGDRDSFSCPEGTNAFVVNKASEGKGMVYGCRTPDAPLPGEDD